MHHLVSKQSNQQDAQPHGSAPKAVRTAAAADQAKGNQGSLKLLGTPNEDQALQGDQTPNTIAGTAAVALKASELQQQTHLQAGQQQQQHDQMEQRVQVDAALNTLQQQELQHRVVAQQEPQQQQQQQQLQQLHQGQYSGAAVQLQQKQHQELQATEHSQVKQQQQHGLPAHQQVQRDDGIDCEWESFMHSPPSVGADVTAADTTQQQQQQLQGKYLVHHQAAELGNGQYCYNTTSLAQPPQECVQLHDIAQQQVAKQQQLQEAVEPPTKKQRASPATPCSHQAADECQLTRPAGCTASSDDACPRGSASQSEAAAERNAAAAAAGRDSQPATSGSTAAVPAGSQPAATGSTAAADCDVATDGAGPGHGTIAAAAAADGAAAPIGASSSAAASASAAAEGLVVNLRCPSCCPDSPEIAAAKERVDTTLATYNKALQKHYKQQRCKPDMIAYSELRQRHTPEPAHGHIPGVAVGQKFYGRGELAITGLHTAMMRGIMALRAKGSGGNVLPCFAIALSGGYKDDADEGSTFWYTGEGGQESKGGKQGKDQSYDSIGNAALLQSFMTQVPVRVFRSQPAPKLDKASKCTAKPWNPPVQIYEGLYRVNSHKKEVGADSMLVIKFEMQAIPGHSVVSTKVEYRCLMKASFQKKQLAQPTFKQPAGKQNVTEPKPGRKRSRDSAAAGKPPSGCKAKGAAAAKPLKLLTAAEVHALVQQRAASGSYGRLVTADISGGLEKIPIPVFNAVDDDDRILMPFAQPAPAVSGAAPEVQAAAAAGCSRAAVDTPPGSASTSNMASNSGASAVASLSPAAATDGCRPPGSFAVPPAAAAAAAAEPAAAETPPPPAAAAAEPAAVGGGGGSMVSVEGSFTGHCVGSYTIANSAAAGSMTSHATAAAGAAAAATEMDVGVEDGELQFTYIADYQVDHDQPVQQLITAGEAAFRAKYKGMCGIKFQDTKANPSEEETFNESGLLVSSQPSGILECSEKCRQTELCKWNHVVSGGVCYPLEVFKVSADKGWGVRPSIDLPPGAFVCCYIGLLRTDLQADKLIPGQEDRYLFDLSHFHEMWEAQEQRQLTEPINCNLAPMPDELKDKHLVVDADSTGNVARFINHSCDPNCITQAVLAGRARSQLLYYIAIVTQKLVKAGEELSYYYGEIYHSEAELNGARFKFPCQCGAANCKGRIGSSTADS